MRSIHFQGKVFLQRKYLIEYFFQIIFFLIVFLFRCIGEGKKMRIITDKII